MQVASIVPVKYLSHIERKDYHMALAHLVGEASIESKQYTNFYANQAGEGKHVILDNGAAEGQAPTFDELLPAIEAIGPTEIVLPDRLLNRDDTLRVGQQALNKVISGGLYQEVDIMAVPQGRTFAEWLDCAKVMLTWPCRSIGISKFIAGYSKENTAMMRYMAVATLLVEMRKLQATKEIHLLGCWNHPFEIYNIVKTFGSAIRGTDSAVPFVYTAAKESLKNLSDRPKGEMNFLHETYQPNMVPLLVDNIKTWEVWCNGMLPELCL